MNIKKILVPTDFSDSSLEAIKMANNFVKEYGSTVDLIHIVPLMTYYHDSLDHLGLPLDMDHDIYPHALENANEKLHEIAEKYLPKEHRGRNINLIGRKPSYVIAQNAYNEGYDLIIMSNKGGHEDSSLRSHTTVEVIRYSQVPVLSISKAVPLDSIKNLTVPIDGSEESIDGLMYAFQFARDLGIGITLLHVVEPYVFGLEVMPPVFESNREIYQSLVSSIQKYLDKHPDSHLQLDRTDEEYEDYLLLQEGNNSYSVKITTKIDKAFAAHSEISKYGNEHSDLMIMSTHGRTGVARLVLGSTTGVVAQHLDKPLLTVHPGD